MSYIKDQNINNIQTLIADVTRRIPVESSSVDICLLATVLHDFMFESTEIDVLKEIHRVLKPGARFAVVEFKKMDSKPGLPIEIRITPDEVEKKVVPFGFQKITSIGIGQLNYLSLFEKMKE